MAVRNIIAQLDRKLRIQAKKGPVTRDDAARVLASLGSRAGAPTIEKVLRKPSWTPVSWVTTAKESRHGRPIRGWKPTA